jgi:uncharacterized protein
VITSGTGDAPQYQLRTIIVLWLLVAIPMGLLRFVVHPFLMLRVYLHPGLLYWWLMIGGMVWQFFLSVIVLRRECSVWSWQWLKARLWLYPPTHPRRGLRWRRAYLYTVPFMLYAFVVESSGWFDGVSDWALSAWPGLRPPPYIQIETLRPLAENGAWYILGIAALSSVFNYLLGEELFFRGVLLPRMTGTFRQWAWAANGVLFATYHVHKIEEVPLFVVGSLFSSFLNQRYSSFWPGVVIHGVEGVALLTIITMALMRL